MEENKHEVGKLSNRESLMKEIEDNHLYLAELQRIAEEQRFLFARSMIT